MGVQVQETKTVAVHNLTNERIRIVETPSQRYVHTLTSQQYRDILYEGTGMVNTWYAVSMSTGRVISLFRPNNGRIWLVDYPPIAREDDNDDEPSGGTVCVSVCASLFLCAIVSAIFGSIFYMNMYNDESGVAQ